MNNKDKIRNACLELFVTYGFRSTSTKMILDASGVTNGSLFYFYPTKDDILIDIYYRIKDEMAAHLEKDVDPSLHTRPFLYAYWKSSITWGLENPIKKRFLIMYSTSTVISNSKDDSKLEQFDFIRARIQQAIEEKEIISPNLRFFVLHFNGVIDVIVTYLNSEPDDNTHDFIEEQFDQYWRSVVKF